MRFSSFSLSLISLLWFAALPDMLPATADTLQTWSFDRSRNQLNFTTDEGVQPTAQLVPSPARIVIDLPGIRLDRPKINQLVGGNVKSIRIAKFERQTTRLVIDLDPAYTVDAQKVLVRGTSPTQWTVQLPPFQSTLATQTSNNPIAIAVATPPPAPTPPPKSYSTLIPAGQQLTWLKDRLSSIRKTYPSLSTGLLFVDLETGDYVDFNGDKVYPTASVIKLPILIAFLQDVDAGKINLNEIWTMTNDVIVGGSGEFQDLPVNTKFTAQNVIDKMITISDNTATNMVIKRMGGINYVNQRFAQLGLSNTRLRDWLPDLDGTNTTTLKELAQILAMLDRQSVLSRNSQANALDILRRVKNRKLLAAGLGRGATIAHKTGYIGTMLGDAGIIEMPNGKRYIGAVIVESDREDSAWDFVPEVSQTVYSYFNNQPRLK
ncbi:MAG: serine hydrolase [Cyanobacteria bacterium]|nr:serine hydrolase [Cyanobacteriota bacterium]